MPLRQLQPVQRGRKILPLHRCISKATHRRSISRLTEQNCVKTLFGKRRVFLLQCAIYRRHRLSHRSLRPRHSGRRDNRVPIGCVAIAFIAG
jgi:hypothetical protein